MSCCFLGSTVGLLTISPLLCRAQGSERVDGRREEHEMRAKMSKGSLHGAAARAAGCMGSPRRVA